MEYPEARYIGATMGTFDVNKPYGGEKDIHPYLSAKDYVKNMIPVVEEFFDLSKFSRKVSLSKGYHPDLDGLELLNDAGVSLYQSYMGIL